MKTNSLLLLGLLTQTSAWAQTLINDNFSNGGLTYSTPTGTSQWYTGGVSADTFVTNNDALTVTGLTIGGQGGPGVVASFEPAGGELNLQVGESVQLSFNYLYATTSSTDFGLGFGFYDTNGKPLKTDGTGLNNGVFNGWTGYSAFGTTGTDTSALGRFHIAQRETTANNLLSPFTTGVLGSTHQTVGLQAETWNTATFKLTYASATSMIMTATIDGEVLSVTNKPTTTGFDSVAITDGQPINTLEISGVTVVVIPEAAPVPEPSELSLVGLGLGAFGWICWRRQHSIDRF